MIMKTKYIILTFAATLAMASCSRENLLSGEGGNVKFKLSMSGSSEVVLSKSAALSSEDGSISIPMNMEVVDGINVGEAKTRGAMYDSESAMREGGITSFNVGAWNEDFSQFLAYPTAVSYSGGEWNLATRCTWNPQDVKTFLACANLGAATVTNTCTSTATKQELTYTVPTDARLQNDIMLGYYKGNGEGVFTANINMYHPMTAIVFKKGSIDGLVGIKSISIYGAYKSGAVSVTYPSNTPNYDWSSKTGSQIVALNPKESTTYLETDVSNVIGVPFIILPQQTSTQPLTVKVLATIGDADVTLVAVINSHDLQVGKSNVFTLGYINPIPADALPGLFSVSTSKKVRFSSGNLVATVDASGNPTAWKFAENQYDCLQTGGANLKIGTTAGDVDLFGWSTQTDNWGLKISNIDDDFTGNFKDWGIAYCNYKKIADNTTWRTMTSGNNSEWDYLLNRRAQATNLRKTNVKICGIEKCLILAPDNWDFTSNPLQQEYSSNTTPTWEQAQAAGLVCLPWSQYRNNTALYNTDYAYYWASNSTANNNGYVMDFAYSINITTCYRHYGCLVRLVTDAKE